MPAISERARALLAGVTVPAGGATVAVPAAAIGAAGLVVYRDFKRHHGLGVNAAHTAACLARLGLPAAPLPIAGTGELAAALDGGAVRLAILQANAVPLPDLAALARGRPATAFVLRVHSNLAFLQSEPAAFGYLRGVLDMGLPNLTAAAVSARLAGEVSELWGPCIHLPNLYDLARASARQPSGRDAPLRAGDFGAPRLQKHVPVGAAAALLLARELDRDLEFFVNTKEEAAGSPVPAMLRAMFAGLGWAKLIEVPWGPPGPFRDLVATMDLHLQLSATETFNICCADAAACGVPSVVGECIDWMPAETHAPVDDARAAADVGLRLLADPAAGARCRAALEAHQARAVSTWRRWLAGLGLVAPKPRGSLDDAIRAARDCPPCRAAAEAAARARREGG